MSANTTAGRNRRRMTILVIVLAAFAVGYIFRGGPTPDSPEASGVAASQPTGADAHAGHGVSAGSDVTGETIWTCAMHPQIQLPKPGKCPICAMELIPVADAGGDTADAPRRLVMSPAAQQLAEIQTALVERRFVDAEIRLVGKIAYDETRLGYITTRFPGRIDRLYVDYTGVTVRKGDHLAELYSPELISAQVELFQALKAQTRLRNSDVPIMRETADATVAAARNKLRLWDLTPEQIAEIERRGTTEERTTIYSPMAGIVIHRNATEGMYVDTGSRIYTIARLDRVWVLLEAYESDVAWLRYGQEVEFTTEAYPGETFRGRIAFIDPVLDPKTRTIRVRVNVENAEGRLKPDMFVRATVHSHVAAGGHVIEPGLVGKWIGPMHPEIVQDGPGPCPVCGMDLVRPEEIGLMPAMPPDQAPLVIPASAPLMTGKRAVVYVQVPNAEKPTFDGREIVLGPRTGDYYIVLDGLAEGERVVTQGNFKIDSALQIQAKPSMMSPEGGVPQKGHAGHGDLSGSGGAPADAPVDHSAMAMPASAVTVDRGQMLNRALPSALKPVYVHYLAVQEALAQDKFETASAHYSQLHQELRAIPLDALHNAERDLWRGPSSTLEAAAAHGMKAADLADARAAFLHLSAAMIDIERVVGHAGGATYYEAFCPMADDGKGASWLQTTDAIRNPFYGQAMLECGEIRDTYPAAAVLATPGPASAPASQPASAPTSRPSPDHE